MKTQVEKIVHIGRRKNPIRDRKARMRDEFIEVADRIKRVFIDKIAEQLRSIASRCSETEGKELDVLANTLDIYQAVMFLKIKDFVPCDTCSYYSVLLEQVMVKSIEELDDVGRVCKFMHENS